MVDCLSAAGVDFVCFGNHECDLPHEALVSRVAESRFEWINTNMTGLPLGTVQHKAPTHKIVTVGPRKVALLGLLTEDKALYRPGAFRGSEIEPVVECADRWQRQLYSGSDPVDLVLPMTHQVIARDRSFAEHFAGKGPPDNPNAFPLVIAAHDHEVYDEQLGGSQLIKVGSDGKNIGVSDICWPDPGSRAVQVDVTVYPASDFEPDGTVQALVDKHHQLIRGLDSAPLFKCGGCGQLSSQGNRVGSTNLSVLLVSHLRDALAAECCVLNAGNIRGNKEYTEGKPFFSYNDLKTEIPFDAEVVLLPMPGGVLADAVSFSRRMAFETPPKSSGGFMQIDDECVFDEATQTVTHIGGEPIERDRIYQVGILFMACTGVDNIEPLMKWTKANPHLFPLDAAAEMGRPAKLLLVDYFSRAVWADIGSFDQIASGDSITRDDLSAALQRHFGADTADLCIDNVFAAGDTNRSGMISREEFLRAQLASPQCRKAMDTDNSKTIERSELAAFAEQSIGAAHAQDVVAQLFGELDSDDSGSVTPLEMMMWLSKNFALDRVNVPGQSLARGEIDAVKTRISEQFGNSSS